MIAAALLPSLKIVGFAVLVRATWWALEDAILERIDLPFL
jgi:hypothetical protein